MKKKPAERVLRWLLRGGLAAGLLVLLLFAGSNLFLGSKPGREFLQKNLDRRLPGLSWEVSGGSWSPWKGITIQRMEARYRNLDQDIPPLLTLEKVALKPYWSQLLRGKKLFREIVVEKPEVNIPVEFLIVAQPTPPPPPPAAPPEPKVPKPPKAKKPQTPKPPDTPPEKKSPPKPPPEPQVVPEPTDERRFWLRMREAKVRLYSLTIGTGIDVHGLNLDLPLAGPATTGKVTWQEVTLADQTLLHAANLPVEWKHPRWSLPTQNFTLALPRLASQPAETPKLKFQANGSLEPRAQGRAFRFNLSLPSQPIPDYLVHDSSRFHFRADATAASITARGRLLDPNTWRMNSTFACDGIEVFSELRDQHLHFDSARTTLSLQRTTLSCPRLALRSERLSLLGNGQLHLGGYLVAVTRLVTDPELADRITNVAIGSGVSGGWTRNWLRPLETPDRFYRDLHFEGALPNVMVNTTKKGQFLPLSDILRFLTEFTKRESQEETLTPS